MIQSVHIRGFQAHEDLKIKLDPHVTTIVGPSDVGKSAVLRAIKWVCLNEPRGVSFLREGSSKVSVTLRVDEHKITRSKGIENTYHLDGNKYAAFGSDVPKEVSDVLKLTDLNFQDQHDTPFWFGESSAEVSRQLNEIVDLGIIDSTLSNISSEIRTARIEGEVLQTQLEEVVETKNRLKWTKEAHEELAALEELAARQERRSTKIRALEGLTSAAKGHVADIGRNRRTGEEAALLAKIGVRWNTARKRREKISDLVEAAKKVMPTAEQEIPDIIPLEDLWDGLECAKKKAQSLHSLMLDIYTIRKDRDDLVATTEKKSEEIKNEMGSVCALCGQSLPTQS